MTAKTEAKDLGARKAVAAPSVYVERAADAFGFAGFAMRNKIF